MSDSTEQLCQIHRRDAESAETWFKEPALGACGRAFIDRRWLLIEIEERGQALEQAVPFLRTLASQCEGCEGAGEIIRGDGNPENDYGEPCRHCKPIWDLIERIEPKPPLTPVPPPPPGPIVEEDFDLPF